MAFPDVSTARRPLAIYDLMVLVAISTLPLTAMSPPRAPGTASAALFMLGVGLVLWWLPKVGVRGSWACSLALPAFMLATCLYLLLSLVIFFCDPAAAILVIGSQLLVLLYVSFRW